LVLPDEEMVREMYLSGIELLASRGYAQYEISNFARRGCESRHNLRYWNTEEFLGFGPSAYSDFGGARFGNSRDLLAYTEGRDCTAEYESISREERKNEYVMLRMRLAKGLSAAAYEERFGEPLSESYGRRLEAYLSTGLVKRMGDGYAFTPEGMYVSNAILSEILDF
jgi:oxygen-independent coproporphyrinogen-3 oxidase